MYDLSTIADTPGLAGIEFQPVIDSTNAWAVRSANDVARRLPLLFLAEQQTAGRGRGANEWWSAPGGITFSLLVSMPPEPRLALVAGLAVCEALSRSYPEGLFQLKWPNDVYLHQRKICGILVESPSHVGDRTIIGVGINVNNSFRTAPPELLAKATSLIDVAGGEFEATEVLSRVLASLLQRLEQFATHQTTLAADFRRYCLLTGKQVRIQHGSETVVGHCTGIADDGTLQIHTEHGLRTIMSGVVLAFGE
jgi:BirA family biotin operon repressor/biotin-[acetyl-CoA-carboxylase] ligase